jgi:precorrin-2 dehydrogenase/sirohydrochlorin ferrochelatase
MSLFPIFLKLAARPCVVVGAGNIAESKIESLLQAEASITVIAPEALPRVRNWAEAGELIWLQREYVQGDLAGAFLVVAGTATAAVNRAVYSEANAAMILRSATTISPHSFAAASCRSPSPPQAKAQRLRSVFAKRSARSCRSIPANG